MAKFLHKFVDADGDECLFSTTDADLLWQAATSLGPRVMRVKSLSCSLSPEGELVVVGNGDILKDGEQADAWKAIIRHPPKGQEQFHLVRDLLKAAKRKGVELSGDALSVLSGSAAERGVVFWDKDGDMSQIIARTSGLVWRCLGGAWKDMPINSLAINFASDGNYEVIGIGSTHKLTAVISKPPPGPEQYKLVARLMHIAQQRKVPLAGAAFQKMSKSAPYKSTFKVGQEVLYFSKTLNSWIECQIADMREADGAVEISAKRGHWISLTEQGNKLRSKKAVSVEVPVEKDDKDVKYDFDHRPGFFLSGGADGLMKSAEEARRAVLAQPDVYMGYTVNTSGTLAYVRKHGDELMPVEGYDSFLLTCKSLHFPGKLFEDDYCTNYSKFPGGLENGKPGSSPWVVWKRPGRGEGLYDVEAAAKGLKLFGEVSPNDIEQGSVGDCSLLAVISALANFECALTRLFRQQCLSRSGRYDIVLWDWAIRDWKHIRVDDRFATRDKGALHPLFAKMSDEGELFTMLLEKAVAVMAGGFDFMSAIMPTWAFGVLTGCPAVFEFHRDDSMWTGWMALYDGTSTFKYTPCYDNVWDDAPVSGAEPRDDSSMWRYMETWDRQEFLMCCGVRARGKNDSMAINGIFYMHAYSLIEVQSNIAGTGISLAKLRNPHGKGEADLEWKDGSSIWLQHPEVASACKHGQDKWKNDGLFWISLADFFKHFNVIYLVRCPLGQKLGDGMQGPPAFAPPTDSLLSRGVESPAFGKGDSRGTKEAAAKALVTVPEDVPVSGPVSVPAVWEFETRKGFEKFKDDCVGVIEVCYQKFKKGQASSINVKTGGLTVTINFDAMTQNVLGNTRVRKIRRRPEDR